MTNMINNLLLINLFPDLTELITNQLSDIFDHHGVLLELSGRKQTKSLKATIQISNTYENKMDITCSMVIHSVSCLVCSPTVKDSNLLQ